jgi:hypothetical protein
MEVGIVLQKTATPMNHNPRLTRKQKRSNLFQEVKNEMNVDKDMRFFEVELSFLAPTGAVVPITATSEEQAKAIALHLFKDHDNIAVTKVTDVSKEQPESAPTKH